MNVFDEYGNYKYPSDVELTEPNTATSMPCDDAISRQVELVIKMSQESYNNLKIGCTQRVSDDEMIEALKNGTPLPKSHGRLVDEKNLSLMTVHLIDGILVCDAPTIIEADKAESEE